MTSHPNGTRICAIKGEIRPKNIEIGWHSLPRWWEELTYSRSPAWYIPSWLTEWTEKQTAAWPRGNPTSRFCLVVCWHQIVLEGTGQLQLHINLWQWDPGYFMSNVDLFSVQEVHQKSEDLFKVAGQKLTCSELFLSSNTWLEVTWPFTWWIKKEAQAKD